MTRRPDWTVRPLLNPDTIPAGDTRSPFQSAWTATLDTLSRELAYLRAEHTVLELEITAAQLRADGDVRADARPTGPRVRLSFDSRHGALSYATGQFGGDAPAIAWKHNVRAIALGLEALRRVDRYGITRRGEQYSGWLQLPAGDSTTGATGLTDAALDVITLAAPSNVTATEVLSDVDTYRRLARSAAMRHHPDHGGDVALWHQLQRARGALDTHHGITT